MAFALWVAHPEVEPETVEALQYALTYGLERVDLFFLDLT